MNIPAPFILDVDDIGSREPGFVRVTVMGLTPDGKDVDADLCVVADGHGRERALAFALRAYADALLEAHPREFG